MLNKLIKYEYKATSRLLLPLYAILLLISIINSFVFNLSDSNVVIRVAKMFLMITYVTIIVTVLAVTVIYMVTRFYKNLLTDEGYLMFTSPAKAHQLITSKLLVTICWSIISIIAILISVLILAASMDGVPVVINGIKEAFAELNREFGMSSVVVFIELIAMGLLALAANILLIYVSIAVGQLFSKHKIIGSFAAYMIIYTALQFLGVMIIIPIGMFMPVNSIDASIIPQIVFPISIVILLFGCICFYAATNYVLKKKLNLD